MHRKINRRFVIGDIHGNLKALLQLFERSGFDPKVDIAYFLGDVVDGYGGDWDCIELLMQYRVVNLLGNHDSLFIKNLKEGRPDKLMERTLESFEEKIGTIDHWMDLPEHIRRFFDNGKYYLELYPTEKEQRFYKKADRILLFHGGFNRHYKLTEQPQTPRGNIFNWDRDLWLSALGYEQMDTDYPYKSCEVYNRIYIGHTPTLYVNDKDEFIHLHGARVINVDTGGGFAEGRVCMLNIDNHDEVYYSDHGHELYSMKAMKTFK